MGQVVARVRFPAGRLRPATTDPLERLLADDLEVLCNRQGCVAEVNDRGYWSSATPGVGDTIGRAFGPDYTPAPLYGPDGRPRLVAQEVARLLGGVYERVATPEDPAPGGEVVY